MRLSFPRKTENYFQKSGISLLKREFDRTPRAKPPGAMHPLKPVTLPCSTSPLEQRVEKPCSLGTVLFPRLISCELMFCGNETDTLFLAVFEQV